MWSERLLAQVDDAADLPAAVAHLLQQQRATWPALRDGETALASMPVRQLASGDAAVTLQANVRRSASTFARTDAGSIAQRPCFLCEHNLPAAERGVAFGDLVVMPNPFPAVPEHLTLADREHVPQQLDGRMGSMLEAARALGPAYFMLYNGPHCGASAPDHFHFQAGRCTSLPVFSHTQLAASSGVRLLHAGARVAVCIRSASMADAVRRVDQTMTRLGDMDREPPEARVNVLAAYLDKHFVVLIFPRAKHRPAAFYAPEKALAISPAALEMGGLVIISDEDGFAAVTATDMQAIFAEVCVDEVVLREVLAL